MIENTIFFLLASGFMFFLSLCLILSAIIIQSFKNRISDILQVLFLASGVVLLAFSFAPLPLTVYLMWIFNLIGYVIFNSVYSLQKLKHKRKALSIILFLATGLLFLMELPYMISPSIQLSSRNIALLGDSLSAGTKSQRITTFPKILETSLGVTINNISAAGSRAEDGVDRLSQIPDNVKTIIVELGANDWRRKRENREELYAQGLDELLIRLTEMYDQVIVFEMPFPSYNWEFIYTQRKLFQKYRVEVIPKKVVSKALFGGTGMTIDGIHLSEKGHKHLAGLLEKIFAIK